LSVKQAIQERRAYRSLEPVEITETIGPLLSESQVEREKQRPERLPLGEFAYVNAFRG